MLLKKQAMLFSALLLLILDLTFGLYIKQMDKKPQITKTIKRDHRITNTQWTIFKNKLGLTDEKIKLLKSQKDQKATAELIKQFIKENPKYTNIPAENMDSNNFHGVYQGLIKNLQSAKGSLKASLNFELADKSTLKDLKRSPRKIAFKMVSDIPSDKIDELLQMFSEQYGLNNDEPEYNDDGDDVDVDADAEYSDIATPQTLQSEPDYVYENLWEDEEAPHVPSATQFGSFHELIEQASHQRLQREMDEHKLKKPFE